MWFCVVISFLFKANVHILCEYVFVYQLCVLDFRNEKAKSILGLTIFFLHSISVCYLMFTVSGLKLCGTLFNLHYQQAIKTK